ncbi:MAG: hypothetical protein HY290_11045 [Planctomycetia bacterium]|nr:hypothetical protein [Planctomycetia bacterium]
MTTNRYEIVHYLPAIGDLRDSQLHGSLRVMLNAFGLPLQLFNADSRPVNWSTANDLGIYLVNLSRPRPDFGACDSFFTRPPRERNETRTCVFDIEIGNAPTSPLIDSVKMVVNHHLKLPSVDFFRETILLLRPLQAFIDETYNMRHIDWVERSTRVRPRQSRPAYICGAHYFTEELARPLGGVAHCLKAPAFKVEEFADGIWIQLCESGWLDKDNPNDWRVQEDVMRFLGIW